jgi:hypothetical protein
MGRHRIWTLSIALVAISTAGADSQTERAIQALQQDRSLKVRAQAALVLGQRGAVEAVPALVSALAEDDAAAVRIAAAAALGKIGDSSAREPLENARRADPSPEVRQAATRGLADLARAGAVGTVAIEATTGKGGEAARAAFGQSLARHLSQRGFKVVGTGERAAYRIKPSVLVLDVDENGGRMSIAVKASAVAVDAQGRMAAMLEGGAKLKASGAAPAARGQLSARALDAAARTLSEDLAARLK